MAKMLEIRTANWDRYLVNPKGEIIRRDVHGFEPSGDWLFLGIAHTAGFEFGKVAIRFEDLPENLDTLQLLFKNGNPRYTVVDLDHGTARVWGNTKYHGILRLRWHEIDSKGQVKRK